MARPVTDQPTGRECQWGGASVGSPWRRQPALNGLVGQVKPSTNVLIRQVGARARLDIRAPARAHVDGQRRDIHHVAQHQLQGHHRKTRLTIVGAVRDADHRLATT